MNNQITPVPSTILRNKLGTLAIRLQQQADPQGRNQDFPTLEKIVIEAVKILSNFYKNLSKPGFNPVEIVQDTVPSADDFNNNMLSISDDLKVVFNEFENLEGVVLGEFNYMVSRLNRLNRKLKSVFSQLGDFILFSNLASKDAIFFGDSFNNLSRIEVSSPLLNAEQCEINQVEGIATLPVDRNAQVLINVNEVPVINNNSNGVAGNNQEAGAVFNGTIGDILDNNPDTWFEYERVVSTEDGVALVLDFTINIGEEKIINFVRINPNNFGTRTQIKVVNIDTSVDGNDFISIKDDIPIAGFIAEDEENVFTLAPSTSKFAGQGLYTFTPRKAKYVHITLQQSTPHIITSLTGTRRFRYAIGIRDINIQALPYKTEGQLISTNYLTGDEVRKVVLLSNQKPDTDTVSTLVSIEHSVSPDNGLTWHQIRPKDSAGLANVDQEIPELLDFNGVTAQSIITTNKVLSLRYKAVMKRNTDAFIDDSPELAQKIANNTELHTPPTTTPFEIKLQKKPIDGTLKIIDPQFGSRGKENVKYSVAIGNGGKKIVLLPFQPLVRDLSKTGTTLINLEEVDPQVVYVDGEAWTRSLTSSSGNTDKHYKLNFEEGRLEFGDGTTGAAVRSGGIISMTLAEERIFPTRGIDHIAKLDYPTSNDQKQVQITIVHPPTVNTTILRKGAKRFQLNPDIQESPAVVFSDAVVFSSLELFVDGSSELAGTGDYSIDRINGVVYSFTPVSSINDTTVIYTYIPTTVLTDTDWKFIDADDGISNAVSVDDNVFTTFQASPMVITGTTGASIAAVKYFNLAHVGIVRGTVKIKNKDGDPYGKEVLFINGRTELLDVIHAAEELDPILNISGSTLVTIPFSLPVHQGVDFAVTFTNQSVFANEVPGIPAALGQFRIIRGQGATGVVEVRVLEDIIDPGVVDYYYVDPQIDLTGSFSINYQTGEIFLHDGLSVSFAPLTVDYEYTNFRAQYDIARLVPADDWEYDTTDNKITLKDREVLRNIRTPQTLGEDAISASKFYQASYQYVQNARANVSELEPFFSPTLKDYALKVITKSRLV